MGSKLKILRVADVTDNRTGGMSRTMHSTGDELRRRGHTVDYLFSGDLQLSCRPQLRRFLGPLRAFRRIRQAVQRVGYDVVEIHEPLAAVYAAGKRGWPPLVIFSYGLEERSHQATLNYRRLKGLPVSLKARYSPRTVVYQAAFAVRRADHVICSNSEDVRYLESRGVPSDRLTRHHSGVEPDFLAAGAEMAACERPEGILFLGTWLLRKGILDLKAAMSEVLCKLPQARFTVAGCGTEPAAVRADFPPELRGRVRVVPHLASNAELIALYREHSVFVLPSYFEGQPLAMIEAAALRMAIVTTPTCGMLDFVTHEREGLLVPIGEPRKLAGALERLLQNPGFAETLGSFAREKAVSHTWAAAAERIEQAYLSATNRGRRPEAHQV